MWPEGGRLGIAVSGGPDSLALLLLAHAALAGEVEAATVDHRLRPESAEEAAAVGAVCHELGVPHAILPVEVQPGNLQANARAARYEALSRWAAARNLDALATAHHADDQAETLLMRLNRGSGLSGLAGIRASTSMPGSTRRLLRPLLGWRKAELEIVVRARGIEAVRDPSNENEDFDRVRIRKALAECDWLDPLRLARSAALLAQVEEALDAAVAEELHTCAQVGEACTYFPYRRGETARGPFWIGAVQEMAALMGRPLGKADAAAMVEGLRRGEKRNIGGLQGEVGTRGDEVAWILAPENPRAPR